MKFLFIILLFLSSCVTQGVGRQCVYVKCTLIDKKQFDRYSSEPEYYLVFNYQGVIYWIKTDFPDQFIIGQQYPITPLR